jgi:hypothetical protein
VNLADYSVLGPGSEMAASGTYTHIERKQGIYACIPEEAGQKGPGLRQRKAAQLPSAEHCVHGASRFVQEMLAGPNGSG